MANYLPKWSILNSLDLINPNYSNINNYFLFKTPLNQPICNVKLPFIDTNFQFYFIKSYFDTNITNLKVELFSDNDIFIKNLRFINFNFGDYLDFKVFKLYLRTLGLDISLNYYIKISYNNKIDEYLEFRTSVFSFFEITEENCLVFQYRNSEFNYDYKNQYFFNAKEYIFKSINIDKIMNFIANNSNITENETLTNYMGQTVVIDRVYANGINIEIKDLYLKEIMQLEKISELDDILINGINCSFEVERMESANVSNLNYLHKARQNITLKINLANNDSIMDLRVKEPIRLLKLKDFDDEGFVKYTDNNENIVKIN